MAMTKVERVPVYRVPKPRIGALHREWMVAHGIDPDVSEVYDEEIAGLLGSSFFRDVPFTVDGERNELVMHRREAFTPPAGAIEVRLEYGMGTPVVRGRLDGGPRYRFDLDTGYNGVVLLKAPIVRRRKLLGGRDDLPEGEVHGVFGAIRYSLASVAEFDIAGFTCRDVPVDLTHPAESGGLRDNAVVVGMIGTGLLRQFRTTIDYTKGRLWLQPRAGFDGRFPPDLGLDLSRIDGRLTVVEVRRGSPSARAEVGVGDEIVAVDGKPVAGKPAADVAIAMQRAASVTLELRAEAADTTRKVTLRRSPYLPRVDLRGRRRGRR